MHRPGVERRWPEARDGQLLRYLDTYLASNRPETGLLLTVLGELVCPANRPAPTAAFVDTLVRLGVPERAVRRALARATAEGWLAPSPEDGPVLCRLTPPALRFLGLIRSRVHRDRPAPRHWDGRWLVVVARAARPDRSARRLLGTGMRWSGFGSPNPDVWISADAHRIADAELVLAEAGIGEDAFVFVADSVGGTPSELVGRAWDLPRLARSYDDFLAEFEDPSPGDPLASLVRLVDAWRRLPLTDPYLPDVLLPPSWAGSRAAELFHRRYSSWGPPACAEWRQIAARHRPT